MPQSHLPKTRRKSHQTRCAIHRPLPIRPGSPCEKGPPMCAKRPVTTTTPNQPTAARAQAASEKYTDGDHLLGLWGRRQANQQPWYERLGRGAEAAGVHDVGDEEERSTSHIMRSMDAYTTDRARRQTHSRQAPGGAAKGRCTQTQHLQDSTHGKRHAVQRCILCRFASQRTGQVDSPQTRKARGNPNPSPGLQLLLLLHPPSPRVKYARQACILLARRIEERACYLSA